jgi:hypothetical protein
MIKETSTSGTIPLNPEMPKMTDTDDMDMENTIMEYHSKETSSRLINL